ncbi:hypothetical protein [Streptomyces sp. NPDC058683]|uniref:hypothetical protein n=1 Tax=Streptomyces sp. NPDC058683 TaxID=3346597 RepID=UPI0036517AB8
MIGALAEREGAVAVFGEAEQEVVQRWRDGDELGAEGESDAFVGGEDSAGGEAGNLGEGLAVEQDQEAGDAVDGGDGAVVQEAVDGPDAGGRRRQAVSGTDCRSKPLFSEYRLCHELREPTHVQGLAADVVISRAGSYRCRITTSP